MDFQRDFSEGMDYYEKMSEDSHVDRLHKAACQRGENGYIDPVTGFLVLTAYYLKDRDFCCGSGCRHCPYTPEEQKKAGRPMNDKSGAGQC